MFCRRKTITFFDTEEGYFQNRLSNVKGLNIDPIRNEVQALKNVKDFLLFTMKVPLRLS